MKFRSCKTFPNRLSTSTVPLRDILYEQATLLPTVFHVDLAAHTCSYAVGRVYAKLHPRWFRFTTDMRFASCGNDNNAVSIGRTFAGRLKTRFLHPERYPQLRACTSKIIVRPIGTTENRIGLKRLVSCSRANNNMSFCVR